MADVFHYLADTIDLHKPGYVASSDPGTVGAGIAWIDTSLGTGKWILKIRNATDNGWELPNGTSYLDVPVQFNVSPTVGSFSEGKLYYDSTFHTLSLNIGADSTLQLGQETLAYVYNDTGSPLVDGNVVYINGATVAGIPTVALAQANSEATSFVLGVVTTMSIAHEDYGFVTIRGHVNDLDTSAWNVGDSLYLSATVAGALTTTAPSEGNFDVRVGRVMIKDASTGRVYVNIRQLAKLTDLGDVTIATPTTDQVLRYNGTEWVNGAATASSAGPGVEFFPDDTAIIATGTENAYPIKTLSKVPIGTAEDVDSIVCNTNTVLYGTYLYDTALGRTSLSAGTWTFDIYAGVSSAVNTSTLQQNVNRVRPGTGTVDTTGSGTTRTAIASTGTPFATAAINVGGTVDSDSFLQTTTGYFRILSRVSDTEITIETLTTYSNQTNVAYSVHKRLFQITTPELNNVATAPLYAGLQLYTVTSVQTAFTVEATDKLASAFFGTSTGTRTVYFSHNGTTRYSHFATPLTTLHGNLPGLQGGTGAVPAEEYYHFTLAQHTAATRDATNSQNGLMPTGKLTGWDAAAAATHTQGTDTTLGAMAADINANSHQVTGLSVPDAAGEAIRQTAIITESALETLITTPASSDSVIKSIHQHTHGFSVGNVLKFTGGVYATAKADTAANAEVIGIVSVVAAGTDDFTILTNGYIDTLTGLTANTLYFLSDATAGLLTATEPTTEGSISKPILYAVSTTAGYFINYRGAAITSTSSYYLSFVNANLAAGILTITHNLGHKYCAVTICDNSDKVIIADEITYTDANTATVDLTSFGAITGTWRAWVLDIGSTTTLPISIDGALGTSDALVPSQKAVKTYVDTRCPTGWTDYTATSTVTGWTTFTTKQVWYIIEGKTVRVQFSIIGESNANTAIFTLPTTCNHTSVCRGRYMIYGYNPTAGGDQLAVTDIAPGAATVACYRYLEASGWNVWATSGSKSITGSFFYMID